MAEVNVRIAAAANDGYASEETLGDNWVNTGELIIGPEASATVNSPGLRFVTTIPQGMTITAARVDFITSNASNAGMDISLAIYGEAADSPAAISSYADYQGRTRTAATAAWTRPGAILAGAEVATPDLAAIIQELVNRAGFSGTLQLFIQENTSPDQNYPIYAESYDTDPTKAPLLHVEYKSVFKVNGGAEVHGVRANWQRVVKRVNNDRTVEFQPFALHTWEIAQMDLDTFHELAALQGQVLTSLTTTGFDDRNATKVYTVAEITSVVNGRQVGRRMTGTRVEFRVSV